MLQRFLTAASALALSILFIAPASAATYTGSPTAIGNGAGRVVVRTDSEGNPTAVMVELTRSALQGLPTKDKPNMEEWEYTLPMPAGPKTGFDHIAVDWNPHGHPPPMYGVPHFDLHFYAMTSAQQMAVAFPKGDKDPAGRVTDPALIPPGYVVPPGTEVPMMGVHAVNMASPEFHGKPFTATFIYGYYKNRLTFLEPMVTRAFLLSHPDATMPIPVPKKYSVRGWYPSKYVVRYDSARKIYVIGLTGLHRS
ncbi:MAG: DUF5602 domain-containing protein [Vulcanimicrobiaceae bacterium]